MTVSTAEQEIRDVIAQWRQASAEHDLTKLLELMADDVVFLTRGQPPMHKKEFAQRFNALTDYRIESCSDVQEICVSGDLGYCWTHLDVSMIPLRNGASRHLAGYTLTIFRRQPDGRWVLARDANLLA